MGIAVPDDADAERPDASASGPARLERFVRGGVEILLDAAHNPAGARALASICRTLDGRGVTLVFGAMRDKDVTQHARGAGSVLRDDRLHDGAEPARAAGVASSRDAARQLAPIGRGRSPNPADGARARARASADRSSRPVPSFLIGPLRDILR